MEAGKFRSQLRLAADAWTGIKDTHQPADRWLGNYFFQNRKKIGSRDRRFVSQTVYGLFRNKRYLQEWGVFLAGKEPGSLLLSALSAYLEELMTSECAYELLLDILKKPVSFEILEKIRSFDFPPQIKAAGKSENLSIRYSYPAWLVERWISEWDGETAEKLLKAFEVRPPLIIRANPLKITRDRLIEKLQGKGHEVRPVLQTPWGIVFRERQAVFEWEEFKEGLFEIQDTGSQIVCDLMRVKPGELIWDVCAGGGGKSLLLAALMNNKGRIISTDIRPRKLEELKKRAKRAGVYNIFPADLNRMDEIRQVRHGFDKILVDAPCSGTGTLRRNPDAKWKLTPERFEEHHEEQVSILSSVVPRLKKGGRLYYVTCSVEHVEDEKVMEKVLTSFSGELRLCNEPQGNLKRTDFGLRLWPAEENDGFFVGVAEKI